MGIPNKKTYLCDMFFSFHTKFRESNGRISAQSGELYIMVKAKII